MSNRRTNMAVGIADEKALGIKGISPIYFISDQYKTLC